MSEKNFIGKQLINIKDKMSGKTGLPFSVQQKKNDTKTGVSRNTEKQPKAQKEVESKQEILMDSTLIKEEEKEVSSIPKPDKKFIKALHAKKEDYLKTKDVVAKMLGDTFTQLEREITVMEQKKKMYSNSADSIKKLLEEISKINESKWNSDDFSLELSEAGRVVERARLENIILNEKLNLKKTKESSSVVKSGFSALDIVSLSFTQVFKLGFGLFLPLITGVIIAALIIAVTMLVSMGTI